MTKQEVEKLLDEDPQKLIDGLVEFSFNEVEGRVVLVDGVAAGVLYYGFKFLDGQFAGKEVYCAEAGYPGDGVCFGYDTHDSSDGVLFNKDPEQFDPEIDEDWGGDYVPELNGCTFTIKEAEA